MTSEELVCPREDLSVGRKEELKKLLLEQIPTVLNLLTGEALKRTPLFNLSVFGVVQRNSQSLWKSFVFLVFRYSRNCLG